MAVVAQLPALPSDLFDLLKYGQFGAAVIMLVLGFYLYWRAANAPAEEIQTRQLVGSQFMKVALLFFVLCSVAEMTKFLLPGAHPKVNAMISVPPLDEENFKEYGEVQIMMMDGQQQDKKQALDHPQFFSFHDNATFTISLNRLTEKLDNVKRTKQVVETALVKETSDLGPGLNGSLLAQPPDPFQPDIPAPLVSKVDDANKKAESGDYAAAVGELEDVLKQRPDYYRALVNLGLIYQDQGRYGEAIQTLEKAKNLRDSLHISDSSILNSIGWVYMVTNNYTKAESSFLDALKEGHENPSDTERVLNNLGYLYLENGDTTKARVYLQRSINDYHSTGAQKVLKMTEQYDEREKAHKQKISRTPPPHG